MVSRREVVAHTVVALTLSPSDSATLPPWSPGAHVDVRIEGCDLVRQFSLMSDPQDPQAWRIGVLREDHDGLSARLHDKVTEGDVVQLRGPRNHFELIPAESYVFIAGGIGITPIMPMVAAASQQGADWRLHYGGRTRGTMAFVDELSSFGAERVQLWPEDVHGLLDLDSILGTPRPGTLVYCCGPEPLLAAVEERCHSWPSGALVVERFAPKPADPGDDQDAFTVVLAQSGLTLEVAAGQLLTDVLMDAGLDVFMSCGEGTCGTCETDVLHGVPDHRDSVLSPSEQDRTDVMYICVSRAKSPSITLDL